MEKIQEEFNKLYNYYHDMQFELTRGGKIASFYNGILFLFFIPLFIPIAFAMIEIFLIYMAICLLVSISCFLSFILKDKEIKKTKRKLEELKKQYPDLFSSYKLEIYEFFEILETKSYKLDIEENKNITTLTYTGISSTILVRYDSLFNKIDIKINGTDAFKKIKQLKDMREWYSRYTYTVGERILCFQKYIELYL